MPLAEALPHPAKPRELGSHQDDRCGQSARGRRNTDPDQRAFRRKTRGTAGTSASSSTCRPHDQTGTGRCFGCQTRSVTASRLELAGKSADEEAGTANLGTPSEGPLERSIRQPLGLDRGALSNDPIGKLAVAALAFSRQAALTFAALECQRLIA